MDKKFWFAFLGLVVFSFCFTNACIAKTMNDMNKKIADLEEQNNTIIYQYELQQKEIETLKSLNVSYASETDAKIDIIAGDVQELKLEKETKEVELHQEPKRTLLGTYQLTAYEWTGNPCANGNFPTQNYTVACNSLPLGTKIYIEGHGDYVVEDRGGMSNSVIDIYMGDVSTCLQFGRRSATVYVYE